MQSSKEETKKQQKRGGLGRSRRSCCSKALWCSSRLSVSSSEEESEISVNSSERYPTISSIAHAMVQEKLDQMIKERKQQQHQEARNKQDRWRRSREEGGNYRDQRDHGSSSSSSKFVVMLAMEKSSYDPREDFRESMQQMITANRIYEPRDLRRLLNFYVSMNSEEYHGVILEVFHQVCTTLFLSCKQNIHRRKHYYL
ncbi:OLC1v1020773C1 [Oldenlandia corymbosa var. corymbosa]|uniref:Transcription repressor n=1 Tax=Oldenlandia corymbosa var. corymbosa TaxID=529605 RepID=A0AAV1BU69_OLDCO|nr:OLC1v1020773C1 [Oldenlandia corymbosa var. corymbosa]